MASRWMRSLSWWASRPSAETGRKSRRTALPRILRPVERLEDRITPTNFLVTNTDDSGAGSLRQAILDANATVGTDTIQFGIGSGTQTIAPLSALPTITDSVRIDGTTQPGFVSEPIIEIRGDSAGAGANGLTIIGTNSIVQGLVINRFGQYGIYISGAGATGNVIEGNYIGTDVTGALDLGNVSHGVAIENGAANNRIGGTAAGAGNLISGNNASGILLRFSGTQLNVVEGNFIGTTRTSTATLPNSERGVLILDGAGNSTIGGTAAGAGNVISGNVGDGIDILVTTSTANLVVGNLIGTDLTGNLDLGNAGLGVAIGGPSNTIGGATAGERM